MHQLRSEELYISTELQQTPVKTLTLPSKISNNTKMAVVKVCDHLDLAREYIRNFEVETKSTFVVRGIKKKAFGTTEFDSRNDRYKIYWLSNNGIPYVHVNRMAFDCKFGPDRHKRKILKQKKEAEQRQDHTESRIIKTRMKRKLDCPAEITLIEIITFPKYRVMDLSRAKKMQVSKELRRVLKEEGDSSVESERKIIVHLPAEDAHKNHPIGSTAGMHQLVYSKIKKRIQSLVADSSFTSVQEIKRSLENFVKYELFPEPSECPSRISRRFYPCEKDIKDIAYAAWRKLSFSKNEQKKTSQMVKKHSENNPCDYIFFRPATRNVTADVEDDAQGKTMLFIFQSQEQKQLMNRYGNYVCLLDATHRTTKYSLPLFFICVKTYVDYHVVAMFVLQDEKISSIMEALHMIIKENPGWQPKDFLTGICDEETRAVEQVFDNSFVFVCDFHREQAWVLWVSKLANGIPANRRNEALALMRNVADSETEEELEESLNNLWNSDLWQTNPKFQDWFTKEWLSEHTCRRWVWGYRKDRLELNIYTNNGIDHQNECLKYKFLRSKKQQSLCNMIHIIITQFFPDCYMRYCELNFRVCSEYRSYSSDVPSYLRDRPKSFVFHCIQRLSVAEAIDPNHIKKVCHSPIIFSVQSQSNSNVRYIVSLGNQDDMPCCECRDWVKSKWLCKHFFAIFLNSDVTWNDLSSQYRESPYLNLDVTVPSVYIQNKSETSVNIVSNNGAVDQTVQEPQLFSEVCLPSVSENQLSNSDLIAQCRDHLADIQSRISEFIDRSSLEQLERDLGGISVRLRSLMVEEDGSSASSVSAPIKNSRKPSLSQKRKKKNNNEVNSPECVALSMGIPHDYAEPPRENKKQQVTLKHHLPYTQINETSTSCMNSAEGSAVMEEGIVSSFNLLVSENNKNPVTMIASTTDDSAEIEEGIVSSFYLLVPEDNQNPVTVIASTAEDRAVIEESFISSLNLLVPDDNKNPVTVITSSDMSTRHLEIKQLQQKVKKGLHTENEIENDDLMELISSDEDDNDATNSPLDKVSEWKKVGPYQLLESDRNIIQNKNAWLNDSLINAAQYILKQKFPTAGGLQDTQLSKTLGFHPPEVNKPFIQILNVNENHWITIATSFGSSTVKIYDSLSASETHSSASFQEVLASILMTTEPTVSVITENVCQQSNISQCGVYAIAFAVALCKNINPCTMVLHEDLLRVHLLNMLEMDQAGPFPFTRRDLSPINPIKTSSFRVYCHCRLPWNHNNGIDMLECVTCKNWYHVDVCENVLPSVLQNKKMVYSCSICQQKGVVIKYTTV